MPVIFNSPGSTNIAPDSLRSDTLSTPPMSPNSFEVIPFKPQDNDRVSLSMNKKKRPPHQRHNTVPRETAASVTTGVRRRKTTRTGARPQLGSLRKTHSLPSVQPRFEHGTIETFQTPEALPQRARRLTVRSKASSTFGLATLVPVNDIADRVDTFSIKQSPAMITLRRATSLTSRRQTATLTSFPTPKFSRDGSGLLSSFLSSVATYAEIPAVVGKETELARQTVQQSRRASMECTTNDFRPSMGAVAPPVQTEVVAVEPRLSTSGPNRAVDSLRRCSTRYISDNVVYEIIWAENWSSSSSSEVETHSPPGRGTIVASRELAGGETLERRLSNALTRSGRTSVHEGKEGLSRRSSWVPGLDLSLQGIWTNPKIVRLFREPASDRLPRSKASKSMNMTPTLPTDDHQSHHNTLEWAPEQRVSSDHVEFFPPLRSRANTNRGGEQDVNGATVADMEHGYARSRFGSMVGASSHTAKRKSVPAEVHYNQGWRKSISFGGRRASGGQLAAQDESVPLLLDTA